jgi:AraC-like DNA-binding protein
MENVDRERRSAGAGDVIVLPHGDARRMGGTESTELVPVATLIEPAPWRSRSFVTAATAQPPTLPGATLSVFIRCSIPEWGLYRPASWYNPWKVRRAIGPGEHHISDAADRASSRPELLLIEVPKLHLATTPADQTGWMRALRDPVLAPALASIHASPERKWNLVSLAMQARVSVSLLDERFRDVLGLAHVRYLADAGRQGSASLLGLRRG